MKKENKTGAKVVTATEGQLKRTRKRIANSSASESNMSAEQRNSEHSQEQPAR